MWSLHFLLLFLFSQGVLTTESCDKDYCLSSDCVLASATILSSLDESVDPCEDFYEYACGGWMSKSFGSSSDRFQSLDKRNQNLIHKLLKKRPFRDRESAIGKAQRFYKSCLSSSDKDNYSYLQTIINFAGGWNHSGIFNPTMTLDERIQILHNTLGLNVFFSWGLVEHNRSFKLAIIAGGWNDLLLVEESDRDEYLKLMSLFTLFLNQGSNTQNEQDEILYEVDFDLAQNETNLNATFEISYEIEGDDNKEENKKNGFSVGNKMEFFEHAAIKGSPFTSKSMKRRSSLEEDISSILERSHQIEISMSAVLAFEESLANITGKPLDSNSLVSFTIRNLSQSFPFLNWESFFQSAFPNLSKDSLYDLNILVQEPFLSGVTKLVQEESPSTLINYMIWRLLAAFYPNRPSDETQRREYCLKETEEHFGGALTALYVEALGISHCSSIIEEVRLIVSSMKKSFKDNLSSLLWMSKSSAASAEKKLDNMIELIGFPSYVLNESALNEFYEELNMTEEDFLTNVVSQSAFNRQKELQTYLFNFPRGNWNDFSPKFATVNAFYSQSSNTMIVPIGMLQSPLFWKRPKSLTYGAFGIIIAHEITHAFDDVGISYDELGLYVPLYDIQTQKAFESEFNCLRNQYSQFSLFGHEVNANSTLGENIADHGGLKIAELAYEEWLKHNSDLLLPGLDQYSNAQLFYLGFALPWCAVHSDKNLRSQLFRDEHAPERFRVLGPLVNSPSFAKAWNCPLESAMNPIHKCTIW